MLKFIVLVCVIASVCAEVCSDAKNKETCIVSAEDSVTCSWCSTNATDGVCVHSKIVESKISQRFSCDNGDDIVATRMLPMQKTGNTKRVASPESNDYLPVVLMHGIGDAGHNAGMQDLAKSISENFPGLYSVAVDVADGLSSYTTDIKKQVDDFAETVRSDPKLAQGFNLAGLSQGGLIVRVYAELYNDPPVYNLISLCGPQEGVGSCPEGTPEWICSLIRDNMYGAPISFAGYWKDSLDKAKYLKDSKWIADWNNERDSKNITHAETLTSVNKYVLVRALNDTVIYPGNSEDHSYWAWGSMTETTTFQQTEGYLGDWIGLRTMDLNHQIDHYSYIGNHLRWSDEFWNTNIVPYFNVTLTEARKNNQNFARKANLFSKNNTPLSALQPQI
eukprot:c20626_g1_i1.p1 GENE.c20626_g1_i1~~c20626_g1_i1.p1  ORF type:complete len:391 (+),score=151.52 c20626_g1_i1:24-1196(+)